MASLSLYVKYIAFGYVKMAIFKELKAYVNINPNQMFVEPLENLTGTLLFFGIHSGNYYNTRKLVLFCC